MSLKDRRESLAKTSPIFLFEYLDEEEKVAYQLVFETSLALFKILSTASESFPDFAISYPSLINEKFKEKLNEKNKMDRVILYFIKRWSTLSEEEQIAFADEIPLNGLYLAQTNINYEFGD